MALLSLHVAPPWGEIRAWVLRLLDAGFYSLANAGCKPDSCELVTQ